MNAQTIITAANDTTSPCPFFIGQALWCSSYGTSYIYNIEREKNGVMRLTGGPAPFEPVLWNVKTVSKDGILSKISGDIAARRAAMAGEISSITEQEARALVDQATAAADERAAKAQNERQERAAMVAKAQEEIERYRPLWAKSAIIAELHENTSDSMTDYFDHKTKRTVVLGWSKHGRDLFSEMRKYAATFDETAELATAPDSAENREKYSMGAGYYLKNGGRHHDGWCIKKRDALSIACAGLEFSPVAMSARMEPAAPIPVANSDAQSSFTIEQHTHTKKGFQMWICIMGERVARDEYMRLLDAARELGGWYSKAWGGAPSGFAFKREDAAKQFADEQGGALPPVDPISPAPAPKRDITPKPAVNVADKLRDAAAAMQSKIDACFRDRETNTPRRSRQAAEARNDGMRWKRAQDIALALAARHEAGNVPAELATVKSRAALYDLAAEATDHSGGYYDAGRLLGRPLDWCNAAKNEQAAIAWGLLSPASDEDAKAEELRRAVDSVKFAKIEGYFPTPADLVERMIDAADLDGLGHVLEPSAGSGAIADALRAYGHEVQCIERHASLAAILRAKGHAVHQGDFLENIPSAVYDAVLMNPPFERGQDCAHVRHAWQYVKRGGALVAIMGAGVSFREQAPYSLFREWLADLGGTIEDIPAGAFKESGTGVASVLVTIRKA